jgi:hypothetical protein
MKTCLLALLLFIAIPLHAQESRTIFFEDFSDPQGWTLGTGWSLDTGTPSGNGFSGGFNLRVTGTPPGSATTPAVDLRRLHTGVFQYAARRTNAFPQTAVVIRASTDGGDTFPILVADEGDALPEEGGAWYAISAPLPAEILGEQNVVFMFDHAGGSGSANARFDDVTIVGEVHFDVEPSRGIFAAEVGDSESRSFTLFNLSSGSITVDTPILSSSAFSVNPSTVVTVPEGGVQEYVVTFAPDTEGVFEAELELSVAGAGAMSLPLIGVTNVNRLAFSEEVMVVGEYESDVEVGLRLTFSNDQPLQGFQADLSWDDPVLELTGVALGAAVSPNGWTVTYQPDGQSVRILMFDDGDAGLLTGSYDPVLTLKFDAGLLQNGDRLVTLTIDDVVGALAVPTADDAGLFASAEQLAVTVEKRDAFIEIDVTDLDFGTVEVGNAVSLTFNVANPNGQRALNITEADVAGGAFSISPTSAIIQPNESVEFTATFSPSFTEFGFFDVPAMLIHDGSPVGPAELPILALGVYGRGDNDGDGMVDAMDIVNIIDFILNRTLPSGKAIASSDLFPFPDGDGRFDVRDLTVSVQAVVRGEWPDGVLLPRTYDPQVFAPGKRGAPVVVTAASDGDDLLLALETDMPLRALQVNLVIEGMIGHPHLKLNAPGFPTASGRAEVNKTDQVLRVLLYRPDGGVIAPGSYTFARVSRSVAGGVEREYATAIGDNNERLAVDVLGLVSLDAPLGIPAASFSVMPAYPNPFAIGSGSMTVPVSIVDAGLATMTIYDILGRQIFISSQDIASGMSHFRWDGRDTGGRAVSPGVYHVSIEVGALRQTTSVVVIR